MHMFRKINRLKKFHCEINNFFVKTTHKMASNQPTQFIEIDGSYLEGGGQILRISTALSVLLNKPIRINSIRAKRKDGGLKAQHLTGIKLLANMSNGQLTGDEIKSKNVTLIPQKLTPGRYVGDTKTAGSVCLLIQSALPCMIFTDNESSIDLKGGTNASNAPQIDYFQMVFMPIAKKLGINVELEILRRGYYPQGGGEVHLKTFPIKNLNPIIIRDFGKLKRIFGRIFVAGFLPIKIAEKMSTESNKLLKSYYDNIPIDIEVVKEPSHTYIGNGTGLILLAETDTGCLLAGSALGEKGIPAEKVAQEAVQSLITDIESQGCVDQYMQDQLIIFMALAKGKSSIRCGPLTLHTKTAIHYTELLTGVKFNISSDSFDKNFIIECEGIGLEGN